MNQFHDQVLANTTINVNEIVECMFFLIENRLVINDMMQCRKFNTAGNGNHVHFCCASFGCDMRVIFGILTLQTRCSPVNSLVHDAFGVTCTLAVKEKLEYHLLMREFWAFQNFKMRFWCFLGGVWYGQVPIRVYIFVARVQLMKPFLVVKFNNWWWIKIRWSGEKDIPKYKF